MPVLHGQTRKSSSAGLDATSTPSASAALSESGDGALSTSILRGAHSPDSPAPDRHPGAPAVSWTDGPTEADVDAAIGITDDALVDPEAFWEDQWKRLEPFVRPFELDRTAYRTYPRPCTIEVAGALWQRLTKHNQLRMAVDGFMILGLIPVDLKALVDATTAVQFYIADQEPSSFANTRAVSFSAPREVDPAEKVKELEQEVKDLTRQLRLMKCREPTTASPLHALHPSRSSSPLVPPTPSIITHRPYVAAINGNTPVCLQLNYLEPDLAPYFVSVAGPTGRQVLPCTIVNHRYILFIAPAHPGGSVAVTVLCTVGNSLRKYCKAAWLEYKEVGQTLSHHAVNQLVSEIPLPSSISAPDPSELGVNTEKSEADGLEDVETATAMSTDATSPADDHPPLTREMLDMLSQPRVAFAVARPENGAPVPNRAKSLSMMSADGTETLASSMAVTHVTHGGSVLNGEDVVGGIGSVSNDSVDSDHTNSRKNSTAGDDAIDVSVGE